MYHANPSSTPYSPARLRPPPWPNKNQNPNKNRHKYYYGTHPLAGTPAKQRLPPRPNIPTPIPILSIGNSRPPPWPIIHHCHCKWHSPISSTPPTCPPPWQSYLVTYIQPHKTARMLNVASRQNLGVPQTKFQFKFDFLTTTHFNDPDLCKLRYPLHCIPTITSPSPLSLPTLLSFHSIFSFVV